MKKLFNKIVPAIAIALLLTSVVSCNPDPKNEPETPPKSTTVSVPMAQSSSISGTSVDLPKILDKLKELQYISKYSTSIWGGFSISPVEFKQDNVSPADTIKVLAELIAKAEVHYAAAQKRVNDFDFTTLFGANEIVGSEVKIAFPFNSKDYGIKVQVHKPLVWDKVWSTTVADCPIQEMSFSQSEGTVTATLNLLGGNTSQSSRVTREVDEIEIYINDSRYCRFKVLSQMQIQLTNIKIEGTIKNVTAKNYVFNHKN